MKTRARSRLFTIMSVAFGVMLTLTLTHAWPSPAPNTFDEVTYPDEVTAGEELVIRAHLDKQDDPQDCIVGASLVVQFSGKLSFTRWTAQRTTGDFQNEVVNGRNLPAGNVEYRVDVPARTKPGPARMWVRESYFCESRARVAFANAAPSHAVILAAAPADSTEPTT